MVENVAYLPKVYIHHYYHGVIITLKLKDISPNAQNRMSGGKTNRIYETYKNIVMPHERHIYAKTYYIVHTHSRIMRYHTGNMYYDVVPNV